MSGQENEFVISRTFNAGRDQVWRAWSDRDAFAQWWGPKGMTLEVKQFDFRPGGIFHYAMKSPAGVMWGRFLYGDIVPPSMLVFTNSFSNEDGDVVRAPFSTEFPLEIHNTVTFEENAGKTTLTLRGGPRHATAPELAFFAGMHGSMRQGFGGTFDQLELFLQK